jgi:hypothetical protein
MAALGTSWLNSHQFTALTLCLFVPRVNCDRLGLRLYLVLQFTPSLALSFEHYSYGSSRGGGHSSILERSGAWDHREFYVPSSQGEFHDVLQALSVVGLVSFIAIVVLAAVMLVSSRGYVCTLALKFLTYR